MKKRLKELMLIMVLSIGAGIITGAALNDFRTVYLGVSVGLLIWVVKVLIDIWETVKVLYADDEGY